MRYMTLSLTHSFAIAYCLLTGASYAQEGLRPSFDCSKASLPDEYAICSNSYLAELDNLVAAGYKFLKSTKGRAYAEAVGKPLLKLRMACKSDIDCIAERQIDAISAYQLSGAPILLPSWVYAEQEAETDGAIMENTRSNNQLSASIKENTEATQSVQSEISEATEAVEEMTSAVNSSAKISSENAAQLNDKIGDLAAQIEILTRVLDEQKASEASADEEEKSTIQYTVTAITQRIESLKTEYSEIDVAFSNYLTSIEPNDRDLYLTSRKASQLYPKVPYYIPGTNETGEFWVEPKVTDVGDLMFHFRLIDPNAENDTTRSLIAMNLQQLEDTQNALFKLHKNSVIAHDKKIRENYTKRVTCFPIEQCPAERKKGQKGKTSTEVVFMIYEDGSTGGRLQQNKGAFQEGVNFSIDSALLLQAYLSYVIREAKIEYESGTRTQEQLDEMFQ